MSNTNISTGHYMTGRTSSSNGSLITPTPGKVALFTPETLQGTIYSSDFTVVTGQTILIDAYNLPSDMHIYVNRIVKSNIASQVGDTCDPCAMGSVYGPEGKIVFRERMTLGGDAEYWTLIKKSGDSVNTSRLQLLISLPGIYELQLEDTSMLGSIQVEYSQWRTVLTPNLPSRYHGGIDTNNTENM